MKELKTQLTKNYQEYLIQSLQSNRLEAAGYVTTVFDEKDPEPELMPMVLQDIIEAFGRSKHQDLDAQEKQVELENLLSACGNGQEIYALAKLLDQLGFKLEVTVK